MTLMTSQIASSTRRTDIIRGPWRFIIDPDNLGGQEKWFDPGFDISAWAEVQVPGAWNCHSPALWGYEGIAWYVTEISGATARPGLRQQLCFARAAWQAQVWLNGRLLGGHLGGDLPFEFDITGLLDSDRQNRLAIRLDNAPRLEWLPGALVIERVTYGGLLGTVALETTPATTIEGLHITAVPEGVGAGLQVEGQFHHSDVAPFEGTLVLSILTAERPVQVESRVTIAAGETKQALPHLHLPTAQPWSPASPLLYSLQARLYNLQGALVDEAKTRFGIRSIRTRGQEILLNGEPIHIRGANLYPEYPEVGPCAPAAVLRNELETMKRSGVNFIRFCSPQDPLIFDLMDEIGLMCDEEVYLNWWGARFWSDTHPPEVNAKDVISEAEGWLADMIQRDFNHPCIIVWGMANESATDEPVGIEAMQRLMALGRQLDPTRLVTFIAAGDARPHLAFDEADIVCVNLYKGIFETPLAHHTGDIEACATQPTRERLKAIVERFPDKPIVVSEFGCHGVDGLHGDMRYSEDHQAAYIEAVWSAIRSVPGVQGGVIWCWADYHHRRNFIGTGLSSPFGPFGVVTVDRRRKKAWEALCRMYRKS